MKELRYILLLLVIGLYASWQRSDMPMQADASSPSASESSMPSVLHNTLEDCLAELKKWIESARPKIHHIAAPGFDNAEQLAKHPYFVDALAMNQTLMERWNKVVHPGDKVYVAGDFGNREWMPLLNGEIIVQETQDEQFSYTHLI